MKDFARTFAITLLLTVGVIYLGSGRSQPPISEPESGPEWIEPRIVDPAAARIEPPAEFSAAQALKSDGHYWMKLSTRDRTEVALLIESTLGADQVDALDIRAALNRFYEQAHTRDMKISEAAATLAVMLQQELTDSP